MSLRKRSDLNAKVAAFDREKVFRRMSVYSRGSRLDMMPYYSHPYSYGMGYGSMYDMPYMDMYDPLDDMYSPYGMMTNPYDYYGRSGYGMGMYGMGMHGMGMHGMGRYPGGYSGMYGSYPMLGMGRRNGLFRSRSLGSGLSMYGKPYGYF